jgi:hypothetical protein
MRTTAANLPRRFCGAELSPKMQPDDADGRERYEADRYERHLIHHGRLAERCLMER